MRYFSFLTKYRSHRFKRHFEYRMCCKYQWYIGLRIFITMSEPIMITRTITIIATTHACTKYRPHRYERYLE